MAAVVKLLYQNLGLDATWTGASTEPTLPVGNLNNHVRGRVVRSTGLISPWRLVCDFGAATTVEAVALISANVTASATITIAMNATDSWGAPAFSTTLTPWANETVGGVLVKLLASAQTYRYLAVEITDLTNPDGYYEVGVVFPSPLFAFPSEKPHHDMFRFRLADPSPTLYATAQTPWSEIRNIYAVAEMLFAYIPAATVFGALQTAIRAMGRRRDVVLSTFSSAPSADDLSKSLNLYGRFIDLPDFEYARAGNADTFSWGPLSFRESR